MSQKKMTLEQVYARRDGEISRIRELCAIADKAKTDEHVHGHFKMRYKRLDSIYDDFEKYHSQIIDSLASSEDKATLKNEALIREAVDLNFYDIQAIYFSLFDANPPVIDNSVTASRHSHIRLPKLEIPTFSGDVKKWKTFIDLFNSMIHNNPNLSNVEKFSYLINSLEKAPLALVKCTPLTSNNYFVAYYALTKRYENDRLIAMTHLHEIQNTKKLNSDCSPGSLRFLLDKFEENLAALNNLHYPVKQWDFILFNLLLERLDLGTATRFETECHSDLECPTNRSNQYGILKDFLQKHAAALDAVFWSSEASNFKGLKKQKDNLKVFHANSKENSCSFCNNNSHQIYKCSKFLAKTPKERYDVVRSKKWCTNCLGSKHISPACSSNETCRKCSLKHHTLLHFEFKLNQHSPQNSQLQNSPDNLNSNNLTQTSQNILIPQNSQISETPSISTLISHNVCNNSQIAQHPNVNHTHLLNENVSQNLNAVMTKIPLKNTVLLSTVLVKVQDSWGNFQIVRVLLDSASQANFITKNCCKRLGLKWYSLDISIGGLGNMSTNAEHGVKCTIKPHFISDFSLNLECVVLPQICNNMPAVNLPQEKFEQFLSLNLADPKFFISRSIDMLIGADVFALLLNGGKINSSSLETTALNTVFGWILMGKVNFDTHKALQSFCTTIDLENSIKRLWELDQVAQTPKYTTEEIRTEKLFIDSCLRTKENRYTVSLPFKGDNRPIFYNSRDIACRRFSNLERRLTKDSSLYNDYGLFMKDYLQSGHMELIPNPHNNPHAYYIPHHCVIRPESLTTKLRVVFDAGTKDANNLSLNDTLLIGPKLQLDIFTLLLRFRLHPFVFTADIRQMYRQILMSKNDCEYQRIVWRFSPTQPLQDYRLLTVTYGVSSAPYLAIRTLLQLAHEYSSQFPLASKALQTSIYVDDVVCGCSSLDEALQLQSQLIKLLSLGSFELRKWASNSRDLLSHLPESSRQINPMCFDSDSKDTVKILGLQWHPYPDMFLYNIDISQKSCTKRNVLSDLARMFDPLGFLTPVTLLGKLLIQTLWALGLQWDEIPPKEIIEKWTHFKQELPLLSKFKLPRYLLTKADHLYCDMHAFCDASSLGYACCVYLRIVDNNNKISTSFVCAKSRVAPLKKISIPRLELCAAVLLSDVVTSVIASFKDDLTIRHIFAWSDSTVALSWLKSSPHKWTTFVSNRITHVQEKIAPNSWMYIPSEINPADCASRGIFPSELLTNKLWWAGPNFLCDPPELWPEFTKNSILPAVHEEQRKNVFIATAQPFDFITELLGRLSSLPLILRIIARFCRLLLKKESRPNFNNPFSTTELDNSIMIIIKHIQHMVFKDIIQKLKNKQSLPKSFARLSPFIDPQGILRVGGRLSYSYLPFKQKHPALLPASHRITTLIILDTHRTYLHPGFQTLHYLLLQKFWIISPKRAIRKVISSCTRCFRTNPRSPEPPMGNLPEVRLSQVKPFQKVGIDFAGPFTTTLGRIRGAKTFKSYLCVFICMATKAIHLELASSLSTDAFLAALRRFLARRGNVTDIYSDCGTNFVGAYKELLKFMKISASKENIVWHYNPPSGPSFGGLWESGVKSVKTHLARVVGNQILNYEEFNTVLISIEALLNSRPLSPLSSDPNDLRALTPGHFLNLEPLNSFFEDDLSTEKLGRLNRWQLLQALHQHFWARWHNEYLHTLMQKGKWINESSPIEIGTLALIKDELSPPLKWNLCRVIAVHPGKDNITRVVTVKTEKGIYKRPVTKICPLPVYDD